MLSSESLDQQQAPEALRTSSSSPQVSHTASLDSPLPAGNGASTTNASQDPASMSNLFGQYADGAASSTAGAMGATGTVPRINVTLPQSLGSFQVQIDQYNALPPGATDHQQRLRILRQLDTSVYAWFGANPAQSLTELPHTQVLRNLLGHTQTEHARIVNTIRQSTLAGTSNELPLDTSAMGPHQVAGASQIWGSLARQQGHLKVDNADPGFEGRTYGNLAQIMQGEQGRDMLSYLNQGDADTPDVQINSGNKLQNTAQNQDTADLRWRRPKTGLKRTMEKAGTLLPFRKPPGTYQDLTGSGDLAENFMDTVMHPQPAPGVKGFQFQDRRYKKNTGSGATVTMPLQHEDPRSVDERGNEVITPEFITLAHELGHAAKVRGGARAKDIDADRVEPGARNTDWGGSAEELINVKGIENPIRAEHSIPQRGRYADTVKMRRLKHLTGWVSDAVTKNPQMSDDDKTILFRLARGGDKLVDEQFYQERRQAIASKLAELGLSSPEPAASTPTELDSASPQSTGDRPSQG